VKKPSPNDIRIGGGGKILWLALVVDREATTGGVRPRVPQPLAARGSPKLALARARPSPLWLIDVMVTFPLAAAISLRSITPYRVLSRFS
jgi:hypothetical protein